MAKIASVEFAGQSGTKYSFNVYPIDANFNNIGGVYCFTKRTINTEGTEAIQYFTLASLTTYQRDLTTTIKWIVLLKKEKVIDIT